MLCDDLTGWGGVGVRRMAKREGVCIHITDSLCSHSMVKQRYPKFLKEMYLQKMLEKNLIQ